MADQPQPVLQFTIPSLSDDDIIVLDKNMGDISNQLPKSVMDAFSAHGKTLDTSVLVLIYSMGTQWLLEDKDSFYEMKLNGAKGLDVYSITSAMFGVLKTNLATANGVSAISIITASCHAIQNTALHPLDAWTKDPSQKPAWFDPLVAHLDAAKTLANQWVDDIGPTITSKLPGKIVTYGTTYSAVTAKIIEISDANPMAQGADDPHVKQVFALVNALKTEVTEIHGDLMAEDAIMKKWGQDMQEAYNNLSSGVGDIQGAEAELKADIGKMKSAIEGLKAKIQGENQAIAAAGIAIGVGLLALVAGIALAPATGGGSLVVAAIGGAAVIGGAITWGIMQHRINEQYDEIADDQKRIEEDKRQLVALSGLELGASQAVSALSTATSALSTARALWLFLASELDGVLDQLNLAQEGLALIANEAFVQGAAKEWDSATELAKTLINTPMKIESKELPMSDRQSQAA